LHTYITSCDGQFSAAEKRDLHKYFETFGMTGGKLGEKWDLSVGEMEALNRAVS
jgi:hypothetical protein